MGYGFRVELWGDYALFTRPEFKVERVSYDIMTVSAARGILEAVYWKPAIKYIIDRIHVYNKPEFTNIRRNEVSSKVLGSDIKRLMEGSESGKGYINTKEAIQQRASLVLKNVRYVVEAHFELTDKAGAEDTKEKHYNIMLRRLRNGQYFHQPCFGCREFPANFRIIEGDIPVSNLRGEEDMGYMLFDMDYSNPENIVPVFTRVKMINGIVDFRDIELVR